MTVECVAGDPATAIVSVIVPSADGWRGRSVPRLVEELGRQSQEGLEIVLVKGERPNGYARDLGARHAHGAYFVFVDDDARFDRDDVIRRLVEALQSDNEIGMAGVAQRLPPELSPRERKVAEQLPRTSAPIVTCVTDSDMVTTLCLAMRRDLYFDIGGMNTWMIAGVDPELRQRVREAGKRIVVVPETWVYHPVPLSMPGILRYSFVKGMYSAWQFRYARHLSFDCPEDHQAGQPARTGLVYRVLRKGGSMAKDLVTGRVVRAVHDVSYSCGYAFGLVRRWGEVARPCEGNDG
jgi:glycosyltransferase involved in cell wall biosynthesis